ncbi:MAG: phosphate transport system substrate-binding protein, partial [Actinomycetota bacterium]|nr:phosphate transport system substrate-binding protein [Actinomycetota bacterium]
MPTFERGHTLIASTRSSRVARRTIIALAVPALLLAACVSSTKSPSCSSSTTLNGSGSTFQKTFDQVAIQAFQSANSGITVNYAGGGSGKGKTDLQTKTVDFAGTDSLVKTADLSKYQGGNILYFPTVAAPITVSYKVSGVDSLQLSASTIAKIFSGQVTKWNDPAIAGDNGNATLPATDIVAVHRADASGTTSNFTKYLAAAGGSDWTLGSGDTVNWPSNSQAGQGNQGVAQAVSATNGAIGYVDFADALGAKLKFASIKNSAGSNVTASLAGAAAAVASATIKDDLTYSPINASGADAYPITAPTWIIVYENQTDKTKGTALKSFLSFVLNDGQALAESANYAKLPTELQQRAIAQLTKLQIPA